MKRDLFRKQVVDRQADRLQGEILLVPRISHTLLVTSLLIVLAAVCYWLINNNYTRKETVHGWLEPTTGVAKIFPAEGGVVTQIMVKEGQFVRKDHPLIVVHLDRIWEILFRGSAHYKNCANL